MQFEGIRLVQAVATQGRAEGDFGQQYVTKYRVMHSTDCVHFVTYRTSNGLDMVSEIYTFISITICRVVIIIKLINNNYQNIYIYLAQGSSVLVIMLVKHVDRRRNIFLDKPNGIE